MATVTGPAVAKRSGITYRQLDYWTRKGWLRASRGTAMPGSGHQRAYTEHEAQVATRMGRLVHDGVSPERAAHLARVMATRGQVRLGGFVLSDGGVV